MRSSLLALLALTSACFGTPQPDPPDLDIDTEQVDGVSPRARGQPYTVIVRPGAVSSHAVVSAVNLDGLDPFQRVTASSTGEVLIADIGTEGDVIRLQVEVGDQRGRPVDLRLAAGPLAVVEPALPCLVVAPPLELLLGTAQPGERLEGSFALRNDCADPVALTARMRVVGGSFALVDVPAVVAPSETAVMRVTLDPPTASAFEEIVLIETTSPVVDRRPITVFARGPT